jgi:hypothetical protein
VCELLAVRIDHDKVARDFLNGPWRGEAAHTKLLGGSAAFSLQAGAGALTGAISAREAKAMTDNIIDIKAKRDEQQAVVDAKMDRILNLVEVLRPYFKAGGTVDELQRFVNTIRDEQD